MLQAQKRFEAETKANGELPIEDGSAEQHERKGKKGDKKVNTPSLHGKGTPSTAAAPTEESTAQVTNSGRTPEVKGPPAILGASVFEEKEKDEELAKQKLQDEEREKGMGERRKGSVREDPSMSPAIHDIATPPDAIRPFFPRPNTRST